MNVLTNKNTLRLILDSFMQTCLDFDIIDNRQVNQDEIRILFLSAI